MLFAELRAAPRRAAVLLAAVFTVFAWAVSPALALAGTTTTTITLPTTTVVHGQSATLTANVKDNATGTVPAGSVQFFLDGSPVGSPVTLGGSAVHVQTAALVAGTHPVSAA